MCAVEMCYLSGACGVSRWDGMRGHRSGVGCGVVEWVKRSTLRWFGHIERMGNEEFVKKVYRSNVEGTNRRLPGRWEDRVKEYESKRGVRRSGLEWARRECMDRERWRSICLGHPVCGCFRRKQDIRAID